ncbi:MAG: nuclear transport factor 2 family protein [Ferruginibacter sp.]|nr:nuclear transport factor 2 family protein [Ferruginibacter sp.]
MSKHNHAKSPKDVVLAFVQAINDEDFKTAKIYASESMSFMGVLGSRNGSDAYFDDMKKMLLKYDILKVFTDDEDVCLLYNLTMGSVIVYGCGWYKVEDGKVASLRVVFDPRPILQSASEK